MTEQNPSGQTPEANLPSRAPVPSEDDQKYRRLFDSMIDAYASVDMNGKILDFNRAFESLLDYSAGEIYDLTYTDITPKKWHTIELEILEKQVKTRGYSDVYEKEYIRKSGGIIPVELRTFLLKDEHGEPTGMWAIVRDISERVRLTASREQFLRLFLISSDLMCMADSEGNFLKTNPAWSDVLGYTEGELIAKQFIEFIVPEDRQATIEMMEKQRLRRDALEIENRLFCRDGTIKILSWRFTFDKISGHIYATGCDVTERRNHQIALRESEERYRTLVDWSPDAIAVHRAGKIVFANAAACKIVGASSAHEILGKNILDFVHPDFRQFATERARLVIEKNVEVPMVEETFLRLDGSAIYVEIQAKAITYEGEVAVYLVGRDITARKQAEQSQRESDAQMRLIAESIPGPVSYIGSDGKYAFINSHYERWFGDKKRDVIGKTPQQVLRPELYERIKPYFDIVLSGNTVRWENELHTPDEGVKFARINHLPHFAETRNVVGIFTIVYDITDLHAAQQQLLAGQLRWKTLYEYSPQPAFVWEKKADIWTLMSFNRAAVTFTHGKIENLLGISAHKLYADSPEVLAAFEECMKNGSARHDLIDYVVRSTGEKRKISATYVLIPDDQMLVAIEDITARYEAQIKLEQRERDLRTVLDNMPALIGYWDANQINRFANRAYERWFGVLPGNTVGKHMREIVGATGYDEILPHIEMALEGIAQIFEGTIPKGDGGLIRHTTTQLIPDIEKGHVVGFYTLATDVTAQRNAQEKLQILLNEKETLLAEVHHRVKNNLQVITSLISMQSHLIHDQKALAQLGSLALRIRVMGQLHTKLYQSEDVGQVDMRDYISAIVTQALIANKQLEKQVRFMPDIADIHLNIETALPVGLIVNEIVSNSQKHAFLNATAPLIYLKMHKSETKLVMEISDNGSGMPSAAATNATLGLRLIQVLVRQLHGNMQMHADAGTTYRIEFSEQFKEDKRWQ